MEATAERRWAVTCMRLPTLKFTAYRNPWRLDSAVAQNPTGASRHQVSQVHLGRIRAVETAAANFRKFSDDPDHEIVVLGQSERLTSVAPVRTGSVRYAAKLDSCGVDLRLCFLGIDAEQSCLTFSVLGGSPQEARGSV